MTPGGLVTLACLLEVAAPKPGNVHRSADFEDTTLNDFLASAVALGQSIDRCEDQGVGQSILAAVQATGLVCETNTNLGMALLLVPLAKATESCGDQLTSADINNLLSQTTESDTKAVFEAIRLAKPGGLGSVDQMDVNDRSQLVSVDLVQAMELSAERDLLAQQFATGFEHVFDEVAPEIVDSRQKFSRLSEAIVLTQLKILARHGDSLIARKCGDSVSNETRLRAQRVLELLPDTGRDVDYERFWNSVGDFDFWLRSDGHRRNPGTTADLVAAGLFVTLFNREISPPFG